MSYIQHHAIIVTTHENYMYAAAQAARAIGLQVLGPSDFVVNGYCTIIVCPDGSKEGWPESVTGDINRAKFVDWLEAQRYDDGSISYDWIEVSYGNDLRPSIVNMSFIGRTGFEE